jgi:hypothetical protein
VSFWGYNARERDGMRIIIFIAALLLALVMLASVLVAQQPSRLPATNAVVDFAPSSSSVDQDARTSTDASRRWTSLPPQPAIEHGWLYEPGAVCFSMHTLIVAREERDSDSTRLVGSRTCTWSSRFQVKRTGPGEDVPAKRRAVSEQ